MILQEEQHFKIMFWKLEVTPSEPDTTESFHFNEKQILEH